MNCCCIVSRTRLYQFIALYHSIRINTDSFKFFVLCMDQDTLRILSDLKLDHLSLIWLNEIEDNNLLCLKSQRTLDEYCWTLKPIVLLYVLDHHSDIDWLTYLDADLSFYDDPIRILRSTRKTAVLLSKHDCSNELAYMENSVGRFNSGIISFRNNFDGRICLSWWRDKCMDWCYNTTITGQFGDQKYLEDMIRLFKDVGTIDAPGVNVAPWNDAKFTIKVKRENLYIDAYRLIAYHYCGFRICDKNSCAFMFGNKLIPVIHIPYMKAIKSAISKVQTIDPAFDGCFSQECDREKYQVFDLDMR